VLSVKKLAFTKQRPEFIFLLLISKTLQSLLFGLQPSLYPLRHLNKQEGGKAVKKNKRIGGRSTVLLP
jgi:hypothetical protein